MIQFVDLYDVKVVDGFLFRFTVVQYLERSFQELLMLHDAEYVLKTCKLRLELRLLHELNVLSDRRYRDMCEMLDFFYL